MSFLLSFPSNRPTTFTETELKGIWRFVRRGYRRDRIRNYAIRTAVFLLVIGGSGLWLAFALK